MVLLLLPLWFLPVFVFVQSIFAFTDWIWYYKFAPAFIYALTFWPLVYGYLGANKRQPHDWVLGWYWGNLYLQCSICGEMRQLSPEDSAEIPPDILVQNFGEFPHPPTKPQKLLNKETKI